VSQSRSAQHLHGPRFLRGLLVAAVVLLGVAVGAFFALRAGVRLVERQVTAALGAGAQIGGLRAGWNDVEITDLRIAAPDGWPATESLRVERVRIVPSWGSLISEQIRIARVEVTGAHLSALRTRDGTLRVVPTLVEGRDPPAAPAQPTPSGDAAPGSAPAAARSISIGEIRIANGTLELFDATISRPPSKLQLQQIEATLQDVAVPALAGQMPFDVQAVLDGPQRDGRVALSGWLDPSTRDLELAGSLRAVDLLALQPYFIAPGKTRFAGGALDLDIEAQVRSRRLHAPGRLTLSQLRFGSGRSATAKILGVPSELLLATLQAKGGQIALDFSLDGDIDDPKFSLNEMFATRIAVGLAKELGFSVGGLVEGIGGLGLDGIEGAGKAAGGVGSALRKLIPRRK
jgi:uncharacterized protein involved in outer membrane biogenesis